MPVEKDSFTMVHNGLAMRLLRIFNRLIGMLKGATALPFLSELIKNQCWNGDNQGLISLYEGSPH